MDNFGDQFVRSDVSVQIALLNTGASFRLMKFKFIKSAGYVHFSEVTFKVSLQVMYCISEGYMSKILIRFGNKTPMRKTPTLMYVGRPLKIWTQRIPSDVLNAVTLRQLRC